jgi:hypothetical protein
MGTKISSHTAKCYEFDYCKTHNFSGPLYNGVSLFGVINPVVLYVSLGSNVFRISSMRSFCGLQNNTFPTHI